MPLKVLVVGASRGVGLQVTRALVEGGDKFEVFALVRSQEKASKALGSYASRVKFIHGDITKKESLILACQGMDAVVCGVGAQSGWRLPGWNQYTPKYVDYIGVQYLVQAAVHNRVQKFVYVSSLGVTRPWLPIVFCLNALYGRVLHWKSLAEKSLRDAYRQHDDLAYYIVRPGGLNDKEGDHHGIIFDQGDTSLGSITRRDVATVCVACVSEESPPNVTFEIINDMQNPAGDLKGISTLVPDSFHSSPSRGR